MDEDDLLSSWVCTALMRIGVKMVTGFDRHFAELGLTQAQFRILLAVDGASRDHSAGGQQGIAPSVLAEQLLIERGTVSVLTNRMVERGWLARLPGENRRTFRLVLTPAGAHLLEQAIPRAIALAAHTLAGIPHDQLAELRTQLIIIEARLREYTPHDADKVRG
jgi:DNA-binding MarR family transcriptional regulator